MDTQEMLEEALIHFGADDIITKMLSQKRDKEIVEEQKIIFRSYKEDMQWESIGIIQSGNMQMHLNVQKYLEIYL